MGRSLAGQPPGLIQGRSQRQPLLVSRGSGVQECECGRRARAGETYCRFQCASKGGLCSRPGKSRLLHVQAGWCVKFNVTRSAVWVSLVLAAHPSAGEDLSRLLSAVESRYNRAKSIQVLFEQSYTIQGRPKRTESGELFLRKPGRMRWQYDTPPGKLFLSDGKFLWLYTPDDNRVEKTKMKESEDLRAPLAFLLGRLEFRRDFGRFVSRPDGPDTRILADPKSDQLPYTQVEFLVTPRREIRYLKVIGQDHSVMEFRFAREKVNPPLAEGLFRFTPPPGAELIETAGATEGAG